MSRDARKISSTGIYHVLLRGINRQDIFEDADDKDAFLRILSEVKETSGINVYCYCLMDNHVHLLIRQGLEPLAQSMKRIAVRYVLWFNAKHERTGHLFQDRFRSEPVEDDGYLLAALRYICQNPLKAHLCKNAGDYPYSSSREYLGLSQGITDTRVVLDMLSPGFQKQADPFLEFITIAQDGCFLEDGAARRTDSEMRAVMQDMCDTLNTPSFQALDAFQRDRCLRRLKEEGFSIRQISRITGVSVGVVRSR